MPYAIALAYNCFVTVSFISLMLIGNGAKINFVDNKKLCFSIKESDTFYDRNIQSLVSSIPRQEVDFIYNYTLHEIVLVSPNKEMLSLKISSIIFLFMKSKCANFP